ncbi:hypothetical protein ACFL3H_02695 [Gemmatimonadota bacterium]
MNMYCPNRSAIPGRTTALVVLVVVSITVACSTTENANISETMDGVVRVVVSHAPEPLQAPWKLDEEVAIGVDYGDEAYMLRNPWGIAVMENGTHVVLDSNPLQLRLYDPEGAFIREFGQPGDGPGDLEFRGSYISTLIADGTDRFEYITRWPPRIQIWSIEGRLIKEESLPGTHPFVQGSRPRKFKPFRSGFLGVINLYERQENGPTLTQTYLIQSDWKGSYTDTLASITGSIDMPPIAGMAQASMDYTPEDQYLFTSTGQIYYSGMTEDWIREFDPERGSEIMRFRWEHDADAIPESMVTEYRDRFGEQLAEGIAWMRERVFMIYLAEGPEGEIWVQRTGSADDEGLYTTDIFHSDGVYRGRMRLPFSVSSQVVRGKRLYAISSTEGGAPALIRYRLTPAQQEPPR